jgi:hypothetical protein
MRLPQLAPPFEWAHPGRWSRTRFTISLIGVLLGTGGLLINAIATWNVFLTPLFLGLAGCLVYGGIVIVKLRKEPM